MEDDKGEVHEVTVPKKEGDKAAENGEAESSATAVADSQQSSSAEGSPAAAAPSTNVVEEVKKVEKEFTLTDLTAMDRTNGKRVARAGETLYYVDAPTLKNEKRSTQFEITVAPKLPTAEIEKERIQWAYNTTHFADDDGKIKVEKSVVENDNAEVSVKAGVPNADEKKVNVKWEDSYDVNTDLFQKFNKVIVFLQEFNNISKKIGSVVPCEVSLLRDFNALKQQQRIAFNIRLFNEENQNSRELSDVREVALKLSSADLATLQCSKSIGIGPVSLGIIFISGSLGAELSCTYRLKTTNETKKANSEGDVSGDLLKITLRGGIETNPELAKYMYATANLNVDAGTKTIWPYKNDKSKIGGYFYIGNTNLTLDGYVDSWLAGGRESFNFNWVVFETYWESETKLIIDLSKGEIYAE